MQKIDSHFKTNRYTKKLLNLSTFTVNFYLEKLSQFSAKKNKKMSRVSIN